MTTITAQIPDNLKDKLTKFIEELGGVVVPESKLSNRRKAVLKELEAAFLEAKEIKEGRTPGYSLEEIILAQ